ncbi:hypothetical protein FA15DRAFT_661370 [Coprinopsis marcescibilis]|uniref:Uncharacterized protein n=1 Tax=Coprinopsis marcescibilis TaxID=230819 RepID=A0A5C3KC86_COPMA|nr:hypothetical protein FA15DRAFT_661370 [Coprinopsis marcescibilis]
MVHAGMPAIPVGRIPWPVPFGPCGHLKISSVVRPSDISKSFFGCKKPEKDVLAQRVTAGAPSSQVSNSSIPLVRPSDFFSLSETPDPSITTGWGSAVIEPIPQNMPPPESGLHCLPHSPTRTGLDLMRHDVTINAYKPPDLGIFLKLFAAF